MVTDKITLIIDGNNLAHFLYSGELTRQQIDDEMGVRLINHLGSYAQQHQSVISIDLVMDGTSEPIKNPWKNNLRIFTSNYPQTGDDLVLERFWFHHHVQTNPYIVITNDEKILEDVKSEAGNALSVFNFVRRAGYNNPVFLHPDPFLNIQYSKSSEVISTHSLQTSIYFRIAEDNSEYRTHDNKKTKQIRNSSNKYFYETNQKPTPIVSEEDVGRNANLQSQTVEVDELDRRILDITFSMDLRSWDLIKGARFLRESFCEVHRREYSDLLASIDYTKLNTSDLMAIAELLLHACGDEQNFCRRGTLMDRVRLTLLQARGKQISIDELIQHTGLPSTGLQKKIKSKANRWITINSVAINP